MNLHVDIQSACREPVPDEDNIHRWIAAALRNRSSKESVEITVRLINNDEMANLNHQYRGKPGATNVLSFPAGLPAELDLPLLGDIVICAPVVIAEAARQGKSANAHWAHMTVHGTLHLLGYDHIEEHDAEIMEALESTILNELHFDCPYKTNVPREHSI